MNSIFDVVYSYSVQNKLLDKNAINYILIELLNENNFQKINIFIDNKKKPVYLDDKLASYKNNTINVFLSRINEYILSDKYKTNFKNEYILNKFQNYLRKNLVILQALFHEIEHVEQFNNKDNITLEQKLCNLEKEFISETENIMNDNSLSLFKRMNEFSKNKKLYRNNYEISFMERMADINSYKKILELLEPIKSKVQDVYDLENYLLMETIMKSYKNIMDTPTIRFFINIGKFNELAQYDLINLSEEDKLLYGLKIDGKDYINNNAFLCLKKKVR